MTNLPNITRPGVYMISLSMDISPKPRTNEIFAMSIKPRDLAKTYEQSTTISPLFLINGKQLLLDLFQTFSC